MLALEREGYRRRDIDPSGLWDVAGHRAFWSLAGRYGRVGATEVARSFSQRLFVRALQRMVPDVVAKDLARVPSGVRA